MNANLPASEVQSPHDFGDGLATLRDQVREALQSPPRDIGHKAHLLAELLTAADDVATAGDHAAERQLRTLAAALESRLFQS